MRLDPVSNSVASRILREEQKAGVDAPDFPGNKTWGSNYNSPYFNCWRSGSYSRKSSGTTPSIYHDALTSPAELPLLETALLPCSDKYQMPTSARRAPQLSGRHSLTDQFENVGVSRRSGSPSDALLNVRGAIKCKHSEAPARSVNGLLSPNIWKLSFFFLLPFPHAANCIFCCK